MSIQPVNKAAEHLINSTPVLEKKSSQERERERDRQTDRDTDRQTDRQTQSRDIDIQRRTDRQTDTECKSRLIRSRMHRLNVCLAVTCHLYVWQNDWNDWPGSSTCYCGNTGVERIPRWESAQKVDPGEENSPAGASGPWTRDLLITCPALYHWAATAPRSLNAKHFAWQDVRGNIYIYIYI